MLNLKEITAILVITLILAFSATLIENQTIFLYALLSIFLIILINITAKKVTSYYLDSEIEVKLWEINRWGFAAHRRFKRPFPSGAFFPIISKILFFPISNFVWMASLIFDVKTKIHRAAKRHGLYTFSEMTEYHLGLIAAAGIMANLIFSFVGYLINFPDFARLNIYYAFFNMLPLSDLDGNKIFFGSIVLWSFLATLVLIGILFTIFII
ncbi:MAG TPA: hypothetical protein ENG87_04430 [Candidatus Pacearchaeota archaeon]|nr:hypothetical protein BMS3Abin17_00466 [archaeon BMS3Abin17]HDK42602.1 hypothetical protein [Candidatus Pacearchaeota archaeon]HDZ60779.1 hypothetical protein [Candidatus Pacearchaeota archaeon]